MEPTKCIETLQAILGDGTFSPEAARCLKAVWSGRLQDFRIAGHLEPSETLPVFEKRLRMSKAKGRAIGGLHKLIETLRVKKSLYTVYFVRVDDSDFTIYVDEQAGTLLGVLGE